MERMVTCDVIGPAEANTGLGNQLFNVAAVHAIAWRDDCEARVPCLNDKRKYGKSVDTIFRKVNKTPINSIQSEFIESQFSFTEIPKIKSSTMIRGYFQSEKYFKDYRKKLLELFEIDDNSMSYIAEKYGSLIMNPDTVSIHVRRGDYVNLKNVHGLLDMNYYTQAMSCMPKNSKFVVFSDDIAWCKDNFKDCIFIENENEIIDFYLMSMMKSNIIANSTFSWWAAWLNKNDDKIVISPKNWFGIENSHLDTKDLIPESWRMM